MRGRLARITAETAAITGSTWHSSSNAVPRSAENEHTYCRIGSRASGKRTTKLRGAARTYSGRSAALERATLVAARCDGRGLLIDAAHDIASRNASRLDRILSDARRAAARGVATDASAGAIGIGWVLGARCCSLFIADRGAARGDFGYRARAARAGGAARSRRACLGARRSARVRATAGHHCSHDHADETTEGMNPDHGLDRTSYQRSTAPVEPRARVARCARRLRL